MGADTSFVQFVLLARFELLLFVAVLFALGALDELLVDATWLSLKFSGRGGTPTVDEAALAAMPLSGPAAIFIPAWQEVDVLGPTLDRALASWPQPEARFYVGVYRNDPSTVASAVVAARGDPRLRVVVNAEDGPTTKPSCLNRLYAALCADEARLCFTTQMVVLHDAEDMVDPAALALLDRATCDADFVQLPVVALPQHESRWVGSHYCDEFAEAHTRTLVVRSALGVAVPGAGVGCAVRRDVLAQLAAAQPNGRPFADEALTEDYELGLAVARIGGRSRFLRARTRDGRLIATRAYFPETLRVSVRQKARWVQGIALQGWDRIGFWGSPLQRWMLLRDRRGPFTALLLALAYLLVLQAVLDMALVWAGMAEPAPLPPLLKTLLLFNFAALAWRLSWRAAFTAREHGWREGLRAVLRLFISNVVSVLAGARAIANYGRALRGQPTAWAKTEHRLHAATPAMSGART